MSKLRSIILLIFILCYPQCVYLSENIHMKTIGLLGGTAWSSTIGYYKLINEIVGSRLGGYHSAKILLKSIDYHDIMSNYGKDNHKIAELLKQELNELIALKPDCIIICCNSLHKYYDMIKSELQEKCIILHAVELVADHLLENNQKKVLLLATQFTMEDGFFARILEQRGIEVVIPKQEDREEMQKIHGELMHNRVTQKSRIYFESLIKTHNDLDAVILGCTEYPLVVDQKNSVLPIIDPVVLQATHAVNYALALSNADSEHAELIPNTPYKLHHNIKNAFEIIDEKLFAYNKKCVPATQKPEVIDLHYVIKENDEIIAGICSEVYTWKILHIDLLFVNEAYRNKNLGSFLIQKVEEKAKAIGATLAHTDTYDFQAKDFYLKHGYEVFGVLDDCPKDHKRYYLKKIL